MTCSDKDGTVLGLDAQPGFNPGWSDGTATQPAGFNKVTLRAGFAVDSVFNVGAQTGDGSEDLCPPATVVVGFAGGVSVAQYPKGWITGLQFQCANPFTNDNGSKRVKSLLTAKAPKLRQELSCAVYVATATDTWLSIANKNGITLNQLLRSNPGITGVITAGKKVFVPPCNNGVLQGTQVGTASTFATSVDLVSAQLSVALQQQAPDVEGGL